MAAGSGEHDLEGPVERAVRVPAGLQGAPAPAKIRQLRVGHWRRPSKIRPSTDAVWTASMLVWVPTPTAR